MIICAHTVPSFDWSDWPTFGRVVDTICNQASIYFFFIAGFLFQFLSPRYETRRYLKQKFRTVIMPYLIMSVPALLVFTLVTQREGVWSWFYDLAIWEQIGLFLLTGKHLAPLWFVPTITLFYLAAPLLVRGDRARWMYFLILLSIWPHRYWCGATEPDGCISLFCRSSSFPFSTAATDRWGRSTRLAIWPRLICSACSGATSMTGWRPGHDAGGHCFSQSARLASLSSFGTTRPTCPMISRWCRNWPGHPYFSSLSTPSNTGSARASIISQRSASAFSSSTPISSQPSRSPIPMC
ncbi:acyltransferase family protein [Pacificimonas flava]